MSDSLTTTVKKRFGKGKDEDELSRLHELASTGLVRNVGHKALLGAGIGAAAAGVPVAAAGFTGTRYLMKKLPESITGTARQTIGATAGILSLLAALDAAKYGAGLGSAIGGIGGTTTAADARRKLRRISLGLERDYSPEVRALATAALRDIKEGGGTPWTV